MAGDVVENRFELLYEASKKFTKAMGLHDDLILEIMHAQTDWEFIIKIDAMLEAAVKSVVKQRFNAGADERTKNGLDDFAEALPMNGRTSLLAVLKAEGCPRDITETIEAVRRLRNGFAHDIRLTGSRLIEIIKGRADKSQLIRSLSQINSYDEEGLIQSYTDDPHFLRFGIVDATLRFLVMAYNITNLEPAAPLISSQKTLAAP